MTDVAIVGIGIHPFGRTDGVSGLQQGVHAAKEALSDAEIEWKDIEFAYGGSSAAGSADTMVSELGLTGVPFMNVSNGCATGGSALLSAYTTIKSGQFDIGMAVGLINIQGEHLMLIQKLQVFKNGMEKLGSC